MRKSIIMLALILALVHSAPALADKKRNPFELPASAENFYNYAEAIQQVQVQGIVQTETDSHVIIHLFDAGGLIVLNSGEKFAFKFNNVRHVFQVGNIGAKSVWFHARSADKKDDGDEAFESKGFEVSIQ